jgi:hypothetical protein
MYVWVSNKASKTIGPHQTMQVDEEFIARATGLPQLGDK